MQMALHTLEGWDNYGEWVWPESALESCKQRTDETLEALRERLAQPELEWVGLTDEEIAEAVSHLYDSQVARDMGLNDDVVTAKAIEAKLKEKNNG
jgi:hypothetical protein